jgi:hypothetical protein
MDPQLGQLILLSLITFPQTVQMTAEIAASTPSLEKGLRTISPFSTLALKLHGLPS